MKGKSIFRNVTSNWANLFLNIVIAFFLSPYVVHKLGSTYYGIWAATMQATSYLYLLDFGVRESIIRHTSRCLARRESRSLNAVVGTALMIYAPVTLACLGLSGACALLVPDWLQIDAAHLAEARIATVLVGSTVAFAFVFNVFTGILIGFQRFELTNAVGIGITLVRTALVIVLLERGFGIVALAAVQLVVGILGGAVYSALARYLLARAGLPLRWVRLPWRRRLSFVRRIGGYGWYVLVNNIGQKAIFSSSAIVVGIFMPMASVTYYVIAGNLADYLRMVIQSASQVFNPMTSRLRAMGRDGEIGQLLIRGAKAAVLVALPIGAVYAILGRDFIRLWMGAEFAGPAGDVLVILAVTQILSAPHHIVSGMLYGLGRHRIIALLRICEGVANVTLSVILVRRLGIVGVALGTAISHLAVVLLVLPRKVASVLFFDLREFVLRAYLLPIAAVIPMALAAEWCRHVFPAGSLPYFFLQVAALTCIYAVCAYTIALDGDERTFVKNVITLRVLS